MKRFDEALSYDRQAASLITNLVSPNHVLVALAVFNEAESLIGLRRYDEAAAASTRAFENFRRAGSNDFYQGVTLALRGEALLGLERYRDAAASLEKAVSLLSDDASSYASEARFALARALWTRPEERKRALSLARESKAGYHRLSARVEATAVDAWLLARTKSAEPSAQ
jgi:tetratricopeptide (TPR) repeat protein